MSRTFSRNSSEFASALAVLAVLVEPLGEIVGVDAHVVTQDFGRRSRGRETDDRTGTVLRFPRGAQSRHGRRLARARGSHQKIEGATRGRDLARRRGPGRSRA